jgi:glutathione synthase/RimK-type ligase-like ATP-grasp enzyme
MLGNIKLSIEACKQLNIPYEILHPAENLYRIKINNKFYYFVNYSTPLNVQAIASIFKDKEYSYRVLKDKISIPRTLSFLSPFTKQDYKKYLDYPTIPKMIEAIKLNFSLPVIVKRNSGSAGDNVFLCKEVSEIATALETIFNINSKNYDYVALVQEYINIEKEYRAVVLHEELMLLYQKDISQAEFSGNLSPLHWEGAVAKHITDSEILEAVRNFIQPIFAEIEVCYSGLDIAVDTSGKYWLIEMNSHPNYDIFTRDNDGQIIVEIFKKLIQSLQSR